MSELKTVLRRSHLLTDHYDDAVRAILASDLNASVLDVGCGNHSPAKFKRAYPTVHYTGIDIAEYNIDEIDKDAADELIILDCAADCFYDRLSQILGDRRFSFISMRHVIEHCYDPIPIFVALCDAIQVGGTFFLSFPTASSVDFPHGRNSTLNFYDDPTHVWVPDVQELEAAMPTDCMIQLLEPRYRGGALVGTVCRVVESPALWLSRLTKRSVKVTGRTWRAVGFETVMIIHKGIAQ